MNKEMKIASYLIMFVGIVGLFHFHLMAALVGGLSMYIIVNLMHDFIKNKIYSKTAKHITIFILTLITFSLISLVGFGIYYVLTLGQNNYAHMGESVFSTVELIKTYLPESLRVYFPDSLLEMKDKFLDIAKKTLPDVWAVSKSLTIEFVHVAIGMFIGSLIAFSRLSSKESNEEIPVFKKEIGSRVALFVDVFHKVVFAQVKISAINTVLTGVYLLIVLPILGIDIAYAKTLVVLTFLLGLLPVVGNLISNTLVTLLSLQVSFSVALASLAFLVIVHKLEYYINAKIVGEEIKTSIWEMLIVMLVFESVFGIMGAALSSVIYGYLKEELIRNKMI